MEKSSELPKASSADIDEFAPTGAKNWKTGAVAGEPVGAAPKKSFGDTEGCECCGLLKKSRIFDEGSWVAGGEGSSGFGGPALKFAFEKSSSLKTLAVAPLAATLAPKKSVGLGAEVDTGSPTPTVGFGRRGLASEPDKRLTRLGPCFGGGESATGAGPSYTK